MINGQILLFHLHVPFGCILINALYQHTDTQFRASPLFHNLDRLEITGGQSATENENVLLLSAGVKGRHSKALPT